MGLYLSNGVFCTQCEPEGFRRIAFSPDRPDVMSVYRVRIEADKAAYPALLSNGNLVATGELAGGRHWARVGGPLPQALLSLRAGRRRPRRASRTRSSPAPAARSTLRIYVRAWQRSTSAATPWTSLKRSMKWDEERFGLRVRPRPVHDRRRRRLQHRGDGEQGPQHLQHAATCSPARHRHRRRLRQRSSGSSPTNISTTGPATASPAATGSSCASRKA